MKHKKYEINISDWGIEALQQCSRVIEETLCTAVGEVLSYAFHADETYIDFPVQWNQTDGIGGPPAQDPLTVYLHLALDNGDEKMPTYEFNLRDALKDTLIACSDDGSYSDGLGRLSVALRQLADDIDTARKGKAKSDG